MANRRGVRFSVISLRVAGCGHEFLRAHQIPESVPLIMLEGNDLGHTSIKNGKAIAAGLAFRPLAETVKDTLAWLGHGARGTSRQAPLHHHAGNRSEGAFGLESERLDKTAIGS